MRWRRGIGVATLFGAAAGAALLVVWLWWPPALTSMSFVPEPVPLARYNWFDFGVVDIDGDGSLEIYSTNHNSQQSLLRRRADGTYEDLSSAWGFDQDPKFPGLEDSELAPRLDAPGLYFYWQNKVLYIAAVDPPVAQGFTGELTLESDISVEPEAGFRWSRKRYGRWTTVQFDAESTTRAAFRPRHGSVPISIRLDPGIPLAKVFVGAGRVHPTKSHFDLYLRDRHGVAWTDYNNDGMLDPYITRGGLSGDIGRFETRFFDELLLSGPTGWVDHGTELGFRKGDCPGRQSEWVDLNEDGLLDLYVSCSRPGSRFENRAYLRQQGKFDDAAASLGLAFPEDGTFVWLDSDQDRDMDMLWSAGGLLRHVRNDAGRFVSSPLKNAPMTGFHKFAVADFDGDGDLDVFAAATLGNRLLINDAGNFTVTDATDWGLPARSKTVNWVDFDNDGLADIHLWPNGLYRQSEHGTFTETGELKTSSPFWWLVEPRCVWFDADNDGDRDLLVAQRYFPRIVQELFPDWLPFTAKLMRRAGSPDNHWIEVKLVGPPTNPAAIGATVIVTTNVGSQTQAVGQSRGAHYSQGHYRLYFGIAAATRADVEIHWPDGFHEVLPKVAVDRLFTIQREIQTTH